MLLSKLYFHPSHRPTLESPKRKSLWQRCWSWLPHPFFPWLANQCAQTKTQNPHQQSSGSSLLNPLANLLLIVTAPQVRLVSRRLSAAEKHRAALPQRHDDSAHSGKVSHCDAMLLYQCCVYVCRVAAFACCCQRSCLRAFLTSLQCKSNF